MDFAIAVVRHTPMWVFAVLAYLIWMGVKGLQPRTLPLARVFITPAVFIVWGLIGAAGRHLPPALTASAWVGGAALGAIPGALTSPRRIELNRALNLVHFEGSLFPLIRNLSIFGLRYGLAVAAATSQRADPGLAVVATVVSGLSAGYFLGWTALFWRRLARAPTISAPAVSKGAAGLQALDPAL
jgi:hypothetical protein